MGFIYKKLKKEHPLIARELEQRAKHASKLDIKYGTKN